MSVEIIIQPNNDQLIDTINFLDEKKIIFDLNYDELFMDLIENKKFNEIEFFLDRGSHPKEFLALCKNSDVLVINFLIEKSDNDDNIGELLIYAIDIDIESVKKIINAYNGNIKDLVNCLQGKPLIKAAENGNINIFKLLLNSGAKIKKCNKDPIIGAMLFNKTDIIDLLLKNGSKLKSVLPVHLERCMDFNRKKSISFILEKLKTGELQHFSTWDLSDCLKSAARKGYLDVILELVSIGADLKNNYNELIQISREYDKTPILHYLLLYEEQSTDNQNDSDDEIYTTDEESDELCISDNSGAFFKN